MRFVLVSFFFMGWVFFELSGGSDFVPRGVRPPKPEPMAKVETKPAANQSVKTTALVAKPVIAPRKPSGSGWLTDETQEKDLDALKREAAERSRERRTSLAAGLTMFPATEPGAEVSLASADGSVASLGELVARPAATQTAAAPTPLTGSEPDIREVSGTRVNMRDGPGTIYPVVLRLAIGQKVEVLSDSGTGWLRLRTVDGQQIGWVSASLIGDATN